MRVLIAADSFKEALSAAGVCRAIASGLSGKAGIHTHEFPLSDGGEGALDVLSAHLQLSMRQVEVLDPLQRLRPAVYGLGGDGKLAVVEMARASGLQLLKESERNARKTTTLGTGQLVADALRQGAEHILLTIGGSATVDAGIGMAAALGWKFLDAAGQELTPTGDALSYISRLIPRELSAARIDVMCDVTSPLVGPLGAAEMYARQKGANADDIRILDSGLRHIDHIVEQQLNKRGLAAVPGAGAAGGLGFGAMAFLNAKLVRGIDCIMDTCGFNRALAQSDFVITGEGRLDRQTLQGKVLAGVCARANAAGIPVIALCGDVNVTAEEIASIGLAAAYSINRTRLPTAAMLAKTAVNLCSAAGALTLD